MGNPVGLGRDVDVLVQTAEDIDVSKGRALTLWRICVIGPRGDKRFSGKHTHLHIMSNIKDHEMDERLIHYVDAHSGQI